MLLFLTKDWTDDGVNKRVSPVEKELQGAIDSSRRTLRFVEKSHFWG